MSQRCPVFLSVFQVRFKFRLQVAFPLWKDWSKFHGGRIGPLGSCSWRSRLLSQCPHHMRCRSPCGSELGWKPFHGFSGALENLTCRVRFFFRGQVLQVRQTGTDRGRDSQFQHVSICFSNWMQTCAISDSWLFGTSPMNWIGQYHGPATNCWWVGTNRPTFSASQLVFWHVPIHF